MSLVPRVQTEGPVKGSRTLFFQELKSFDIYKKQVGGGKNQVGGGKQQSLGWQRTGLWWQKCVFRWQKRVHAQKGIGMIGL